MSELETGVVILHGRPVIIQKIEPSFVTLMEGLNGKGSFPYRYVVVEIGRIEEKAAWLWDGFTDV